MKKVFTIMLSLTLALSALFSMPVIVNAAETTVTDGATNLRWSDDLICTWDIGTNPKVNGTDAYGLRVLLEGSKDGIDFTSTISDTWWPGQFISSYDNRHDISSSLESYKYFRFRVGYYLESDGNIVAYSDYSDVLDLSAATAYEKPTNVTITDTTVSWQPVSGASTYSITVWGAGDFYKKTTITNQTSCNIATELAEAKAAGEFNVEVAVCAGNIDTEYTKSTTKIPSALVLKYLSIENLSVGGVTVTDTNKNDILGDGTVSYDFVTNTLTLNNANITNHINYNWVSSSIFSSYNALHIVLIGNNTITQTNAPDYYDDAIGISAYNSADFSISGPGSLTINNENYGYVWQYGILAKDCTIKDATINIVQKGKTDRSFGFKTDGATTFDNVKMNIDTTAFIIGGGNGVGDFNAAYDDTLTLNGNSVVNIHTNSPNHKYTTSVDIYNLVMNAGCINIESEDVVRMQYKHQDVTVESELAQKAQYFEPNKVMLSSAEIVKKVIEPTCTKAGSTTFTCPDCGEKVVIEGEPALGHEYEKEVVTKATLTTNGKIEHYCTNCNKLYTKGTTTITKVASVKLDTTTYTYNGKAKKPSVTVKDAKGGKLVKGVDYTVTYATGRTKVGKYNVTIKGMDKYKFTKTLTFKINPKKAVIYSITRPSKGKMTVKMSTKVSATGGGTYQIQYKKSGTSTWKSTTTTAQSKTISSLTKGKKYNVRVRAYKMVNGNRYNGAWSTTKTSAAIK